MTYCDLEKNFFGRKQILSLLNKRVGGLKEGCRQNIALLGAKYTGKSSVLHDFITNLDDEDVTVIYLDLENKDFTYFFNKFAGSLLYNFSKNRGLPLYDDLNFLLESAKSIIPQTVQVIQKIRKEFMSDKFSAAFLGLLTLPEIFTNETGKFCILILDEFQNLEEFLLPDVFQTLGKKIMTQKRCLYVVSSSNQFDAQRILSEELSLLFGSFETVDVDTFDFSDSQKFITLHLREVNIGDQLRDFLADFTKGHPLYLKLICRELVHLSAVHKQSEIYLPLVARAAENTIFDRWGVISRHFEIIVNDLCAGKNNRIVSPILISLSNGKYKVDDLVVDTGVKKTQIIQKLNRLIEMGIGVKNGNFHYFKDKLFKYWIKYVYQKRLRDVELAPDKQRQHFCEEFYLSFDRFKESSGQDLSTRIVDLLNCFENEALHLNGRKYKLSEFSEVIPVKLEDENGCYVDIIRASTKDTVWLVAFKESVGEDDVNTILNAAKRSGKRSEKCLIISLEDLDDNTRLKALQERCWIWNEGELNTLLTLFDKPSII